MQPLTGLRVLDLSRLIPGPLATLVLADLGATVDKIEDPGQGDYLRHMPPQIAGRNPAFELLNRGKRSLVLDLKHAEGREALLEIVGSYDVLFEQFRPGVLARLGLDPKALRVKHPRLVIASLTGYGQTGPLAHRAGHDLNYLARAGLLGAQGPANAAPQVPGFQLADVSGGLWSVIAILAALRERDRTGEGAWLDVAMSEGTLHFATTSIGAAIAGEPGLRGDEALTGGLAVYGVYATADARHVAFAALEPKFWMSFCAEYGLTPSLADLAPGPHQAELRERLAAVFASRTLEAWCAWSTTHDLLVEPVLRPDEALADEHLRARGVVFEREANGASTLDVRTPVTPRDIPLRAAPAPGANTREALLDAGMSKDRVEQLFNLGVVR
jgi:alpha-methylacyl-CoA racemase